MKPTGNETGTDPVLICARPKVEWFAPIYAAVWD